MERKPGALQALQEYLDNSAYRTRADSAESQGRARSSYHSLHTSRNGLAGRDDSSSVDITDPARGSNPWNGRSSHAQEDVEVGHGSMRTLHLLSCTEKGRHALELHQEPVTHFIDDRQLFYALRRNYHEHRGKFRPYWSFRTVHSINFMKVSFHCRLDKMVM